MANAMPNTNTPLTTYAAFKTYATTLKDEPDMEELIFATMVKL